jgi:hypothetical protein
MTDMEKANTVGKSDKSVEQLNTEFASSSVIEAFVPASPEIDLRHSFERWDGSYPTTETNSIVPWIEQRPFVLLGIHDWNAIARYHTLTS